MVALRSRSLRRVFAVALVAIGGAAVASCAESPTAPPAPQAGGACYIIDGQVFCE